MRETARFPDRTRAPRWDLGGAALAAAISQATSAAAIFLLAAFPGDVSDPYSAGSQIATTLLAGPVFGVLYLLAVGRPGYTHWFRWRVITMSGAMALGAVGVFGFMAAPSSFLIVSLFALGSAALCSSGIYAVRLACLGQVRPMLTTTIPSNLALIVGLGVNFCLGDSAHTRLIPAAMWCGGAIVWAVRCRYRELVLDRSVDDGATRSLPLQPSSGLQATSLVVGLASSTLVPVLLLSASSQLPGGQLTIILIVQKLVASVTSVFVNPWLASRFHWNSTETISLTAASRVSAAGGLLGLAGIPLLIRSDGMYVDLAAVVPGVALCAICAPVFFRKINNERTIAAIWCRVLTDVALSLALLAVFVVNPSIPAYFAVIGISQAVTIVVVSGFTQARLGMASGLMFAVTCVIWSLL